MKSLGAYKSTRQLIVLTRHNRVEAGSYNDEFTSTWSFRLPESSGIAGNDESRITIVLNGPKLTADYSMDKEEFFSYLLEYHQDALEYLDLAAETGVIFHSADLTSRHFQCENLGLAHPPSFVKNISSTHSVYDLYLALAESAQQLGDISYADAFDRLWEHFAGMQTKTAELNTRLRVLHHIYSGGGLEQYALGSDLSGYSDAFTAFRLAVNERYDDSRQHRSLLAEFRDLLLQDLC